MEDFKIRYRSLLDPGSGSNAPSILQEFINTFHWTSRDALLGTSLIFLSEASWQSLELKLSDSRSQKSNQIASEQPINSQSYTNFSEFDDISSDIYENESHNGSEFQLPPLNSYNLKSGPADVEKGQVHKSDLISADQIKSEPVPSDVQSLKSPPKKKMSRQRKRWVCLTWFLTWWIPSFCLSICGRMKRVDIRMAWREKIALCFIILFMCLFLLFFIIIFGKLLCPKQLVFASEEVKGQNDIKDPYVYAYGRVFEIKDLVQNHINSYQIKQYVMQEQIDKTDVSPLFYKVPLFDDYCPGLPKPPSSWDNISGRLSVNASTYPQHSAVDPSSGKPRMYLEFMNQYARARVAFRKETIKPGQIVLYDNVYDISTYANAGNNFLGVNVQNLFSSFSGQVTISNLYKK